jgi:hypothetical protein
MPPKKEKLSRLRVGETVVSVFVKQALLAGATLEQLSAETRRPQAELARMLDTLEQLEEMLAAESNPSSSRDQLP